MCSQGSISHSIAAPDAGKRLKARLRTLIPRQALGASDLRLRLTRLAVGSGKVSCAFRIGGHADQFSIGDYGRPAGQRPVRTGILLAGRWQDAQYC